MKSQELKERIAILLDSEVTAYSIEMDTGVSRALISRYRNGENSIENMTIGVANKLEKYGLKNGLYN